MDTSYAGQLLAGGFYLLIGLGLLHLGQRTRQSPELLLGVYFLFTGLDYSLSMIPLAFGWAAARSLMEASALSMYAIAVVALLLFTRTVFRPSEAWSSGLIALCTVGLISGLAGSFAAGNWDGGGPDDPAYWLYFLGYTAACGWVAAEAGIAAASARKRERIGLCDPVVANRFLLWFGFGSLQLLSCLILFFVDTATAAGDAMSRSLDALLGITELASIGSVWLAFFPPAAYRRWVSGSSEPTEA